MGITIDGFKLITGTYVACTIKGYPCIGRVVESPTDDSKIYICQDIKNGAMPPNTCEFKYGWVTGLDIDNKLSQGVVIYKTYTPEEIATGKEITMKVILKLNDELQYVDYIFSGFKKGKYTSSRVGVSKLKICKYNPHPDCCGALILYNFCNSGDEDYSRYKYLNESDFNNIRRSISGMFSACKIVHLSNKQIAASKLVEAIGGEEKYTYKNPNSQNHITVYHIG